MGEEKQGGERSVWGTLHVHVEVEVYLRLEYCHIQ